MIDICCYCGKEYPRVNNTAEGVLFDCCKNFLCSICFEWGITYEEIFPTISEVLSQGKDSQLAGGILFTNGKQILLLKRDGDCDFVDHWGIPGGKSKENETPHETAHRESKEECGSNHGEKFAQHHDKNGKNHFHTFLHSIVKPFDIKLSKEHSESKWVDLDKVDSLKLHPKFKESWPTLLKMIKERFPDKISFVDWFTTKNS